MNQTVAADVTNEVEEIFDDEKLEEIKQKSVSGAVSYFIRTLFLNAIGLATQGILGAYLSVVDFGIFGFVTQFVGLFSFFSDIGLGAALVQKKTEPSLTDYRTAFTIQQILSWLIFLGFFLLMLSGIVQQKTGPVGSWLLIALGLSFPLASLKTIPSIMMERKLDFQKLVIPQIFEQIVYNGVLIFFAFRHTGVQSYTYAIFARSVVGVLSMTAIHPWRIGFSFNRESLRSLLGYGFKFQLNDFLSRVKDQFFYIVLGSFFSLTEFGYIQWSKTWSMYPYNLTVQNVMAITFPTFSRLQKNKEALGKAIDKSLFFITLAIFPILVGMSVFVIPFVHLVAKYHKWQPAVFSLIFFTLSIAWSAISQPLTNTLNAIGEINTSLKLMLMWIVLTWVLTPIFIYFFGFNGVALAAFVIAFSSLVPLIEVKKLVPIHAFESTWRQLVAAVAMGIVGIILLPFASSNLISMAGSAVFTSLVYGGTVLLFGKEKLIAEIQSLRKKKGSSVAAAGTVK